MADQPVAATKVHVLGSPDVETVIGRLYSSVKAAESLQAKPQKELAGLGKLRKPLLPADQLARLLEMNTYHARAVKTKARDVAGLGWYFEPKEDLPEDEDPDGAQLEAVKELFNSPHPQLTLEEIFHRLEVDLEGTGNGYLEVIRSTVAGETAINGQRAILGLAHVPAATVFRHEDMDRFVQVRGRKKVWFRPIGEERELNFESGLYSDEKRDGLSAPDEIPPERLANDIIHFMEYNPRDDYYGAPDIIPALMALSGDMERAEYVNEFFENNCVPRWMLTIVGADLDEPTRQQIEEFFHKKLKESARSTMIMTVAGKVDTVDGQKLLDSSNIKVEWKPLDTDVHEASFRLFRKDNRDEVLVAHGVPGYRVGVEEAGALAGNMAREATTVYKQSVVEPRQRILEARINRHILWDAFGATDWEFRFVDLDDRDELAEAESVRKDVDKALRTPNEGREFLGLPRVEHPAMDLYYMEGEPITSAEEEGEEEPSEEEEAAAAATEALAASLQSLHRELLAIVEKASDNGGLPVDRSLIEGGIV